MKHLRVECLLNQYLNASIKWLNLRAYPLAEFCRCQMDVQTSRVGALVSGNQRNVLQAHPCPFQDGTPLMTQGMRGQRSEANLLSYSFDDLIKSSNSQWTAWVPCGFRQENQAKVLAIVSSDEGATISFDVLADQIQDRSRNGNIPHAPVFGRFWADRDHLSCPVEIIHTQGHEFLTPESGIVGQQDHGARASIFLRHDMRQELIPHRVFGNPRQAHFLGGWPSRRTLSIATCISSSNGIDGIGPQPFPDEELVKETTGNHTLCNGIVGKPASCDVEDLGLILNHASSSPSLGGTSLEVGNVAVEISFIGFKKAVRLNAAEVGEQIFNRARIRIERLGALSLKLESLYKSTSGWICCDTGVIDPCYFWSSHDFFLVAQHFHSC